MWASQFLEAVLWAGKPGWVSHPIPCLSTVSPSPFLPGDGCSDSPISDVLSGSKVCKTESGAETAPISSSEVATTAFVVTFPLSCARNRSMPLGSPEWLRSWCPGDDDLAISALGPRSPAGLAESYRPCSWCWEQQALLLLLLNIGTEPIKVVG